MTESTPVSLNLQSPNISTVVYAVQNDKLSRHIFAQLRDGSAPWTPPAGALASIRYLKPDGTAGFYDVDENNDPAIVVSGSVATLTLAEQCTTVPGDVYMQLNFYGTDGSKLTTFCWLLRVQKSVLEDATIISSDYYNVLTDVLTQVAEDRAAVEAIAASITLPWPIASGGTDATTPGAALSNIGGIRSNLLDNWYFSGGGSQSGWGKFPVNQRGQASYSVSGYTIDRWINSLAASAVNVKSDCVQFVSGNAASYKRFRQLLAAPLEEGKTYTVSMLYKLNSKSGSTTLRVLYNKVSSVTFGAYSVPADTGINLLTHTVTIPSGQAYDNGVEILTSNTASDTLDIDIYAIKLELGSSQTLAHLEGGTWVLNEVPKFEDALKVCQYYLVPIRGDFARAVIIGSNTAYFSIHLPHYTGQSPTIVDASNLVVRTPSGANQTGFTFAASAQADTSFNIAATKTSHGLSDATLTSNGITLITFEP